MHWRAEVYNLQAFMLHICCWHFYYKFVMEKSHNLQVPWKHSLQTVDINSSSFKGSLIPKLKIYNRLTFLLFQTSGIFFSSVKKKKKSKFLFQFQTVWRCFIGFTKGKLITTIFKNKKNSYILSAQPVNSIITVKLLINLEMQHITWNISRSRFL